MRFSPIPLAALVAGLTVTAARADVKLPAVLADGMVLQQKAPVRLFGSADPGEKVTASIDGKTASANANDEGRWELRLPALKAGGPFTLTVEGKNKIELKDVLVGEVWVCSGQSNMEWSLSRASNGVETIPTVANPNIRLFHVKKARADKPAADVSAKWEECKPETVPSFSAVGYFFGRDLQKARGVPIGLIESDWGGTPAEAWTPEEYLRDDPALAPVIASYPAAKERYEKAVAEYPAVEEKAKAEGRAVPRRPNAPWRYAELYNAMIDPITKYTVRGAIWYQGESNAGRAEQYRTLFPTMIKSWRERFANPDLVFLCVQLAPFSSGNSAATPYAELREAQEYATKALPNVGMAVITDVGEELDIHPKRKEPVGQRLALLARKIAYGEKIEALSPSFQSVRFENGKAVVKFANAGGGLVAKGGEMSGKPVVEGTPTGFTLAGEDGKFYPAEATISGKDTVTVSSPSVPQPVAVRYGFQNFPVVNLFSKEGLPASPFRSDAPKGQYDGSAAKVAGGK